MAFISETFHQHRLAGKQRQYRDPYIVDGGPAISDHGRDHAEDVKQGIRCRKSISDRKTLHTEKIFDSLYRVYLPYPNRREAEHTCENCGFTGKIKEL